MLKIIAKENATIKVEQSNFPLGVRDTIKIKIEDPIIKQYIKSINTETCIPEYNLYSYGNFDNVTDVEFIKTSLNAGSSVSVADGYGVNCSRCLKCEAGDLGLGLCVLKPTTPVIHGLQYKLSCYVNTDTDVELMINGESVIINSTNGEWKQAYIEFIPETEVSLSINISNKGTLYFDSLMLFESSKEIHDNYFDNVEVEVVVKNPIQDTVINEIINYSDPNDKDTFVLMYVPPITVVDYQDNLLCQLRVNLYQEPKDKYLGDTEYNKVKECVYNSDPFILTGYILPPDSDRYELVVGDI